MSQRQSEPAPQQDEDQNNRGNFTRNLNKEADSAIARKMFVGGLFLLPWLWAVNVFYYRKHLFNANLDPNVTRCINTLFYCYNIKSNDYAIGIRRSFAGFILVTTAIVAWAITFQLSWKSQGWESLLLQIPTEDLEAGW